jgi:hypothetical protein
MADFLIAMQGHPPYRDVICHFGPTEKERMMSTEFIAQHDLAALIRVMINSSEFLTFR